MKSACAQRRQTECRVRLSDICNFISRLKRWPTGIFQSNPVIKYCNYENNQKQIQFYNSVGMFVYKIQQTGKRVDSEQKCWAQPDKVPLSRVYCKSWSGSQFYLFYKPTIFWNLLQGKERVIKKKKITMRQTLKGDLLIRDICLVWGDKPYKH